jgi:hypothetical protein
VIVETIEMYMKRIAIFVVVILIALIVGFAIGRLSCDNSQVAHKENRWVIDTTRVTVHRIDTLVGGVDTIRLKIYYVPKDTSQLYVDTVSNNNSMLIEDFDGFIVVFSLDSAFQASRIRYPLKSIDIDGKVKMLKEWDYSPLFTKQCGYYVEIYDNFEMKLNRTNYRLVHDRGIDCGISVYFYFENINGKWYLVKLKDMCA